jgi:hypothetical protein
VYQDYPATRGIGLKGFVMSTLNAVRRSACEQIITEICALNWSTLSEPEMLDAARAYYFFSIQFRENLQIARALYPDDANLLTLEEGECATDNLSPYPSVAAAGEKMDHDEFMHRLLQLAPDTMPLRGGVADSGARYLSQVRAMDDVPRAASIASYENTGLERVFTAMLTAPEYDTKSLNAFRHFLKEHIRFDSDPEAGHGALSRHLVSDDSIIPIWAAFKTLLVEIVPALAVPPAAQALEILMQAPLPEILHTRILELMAQIATQQQRKLAVLTDDLPLLESGLDSLCIAVLVANLDDEFGIDPFSGGSDAPFPVSVGDFIKLYQTAEA